MSEDLSDYEKLSKALDLLIETLESLSPEDRDQALGRIESNVDAWRQQHDRDRGVSPEVKAARELKYFARAAAHILEHGSEPERKFFRSELDRIGPAIQRPSSAAIQRDVASRIAAYAAMESDDGEGLSSALEAILDAAVDVEQAMSLIRAFRRRQGERARGAPSREEAMHALLQPLGYSQSVESLRKNLLRAK